MLRDRLILIIPGVVLIALVLFYQYGHEKKPQPAKKPDITQQENSNQSGQATTWYIKFSVKDQKSTAYTEEVGAPLASNGKTYFVGGAAVHPRYPLHEGGEARTPIIPFGTTLYLSKPVDILGTSYDQLIVADTGDVYYGLWRNYPYWVDVYHGRSYGYNLTQAGKYGVKPITYSWYEAWQ